MNTTWQTKKLEDLYEITSSKRVFKSEWKNNGVPFYRAREIVKLAKNGFVKNELFISEEMFEKYSAKYGAPQEGDIMVTGVGTLGICYVVKKDDKFYFKDGNIIWLKRNSDINTKYIEYAFKSELLRKQIDNSVGATVGTFTIIKAKNTFVPVPSLTEQQRIVKILDEAFEKINKVKSNAEKNFQNSKEFFETYLQNIFKKISKDWQETTIGETCNLMTGGTPSRVKNEYFKNGEINWLVSGDINKKEIKDCDGKITELGMKNSNAKYLPENSVMIALNGQGKTRGTVAMLRIKATCNQSLVSIYPKDDSKLMPELIFANLDGRYNELRKLTGDTGNDRRGLNMPLIRNITFSFPKSLSKQKEIVTKLDKLSKETKKLESIYKQKLTDLEELKKSILSKAFSGEL